MVVVHVYVRSHIRIHVLGCRSMVGGDTVIDQLINAYLLNTTILYDGECKNAALILFVDNDE
jgi:hypothetical protein